MAVVAIVLLVALVVLILLGVAIPFSLAGASIIAVVIDRGIDAIPTSIAAQRMVHGLNTFTWAAIPLFLLVGHLMNSGGVTDRIFRFAVALVGHVRGGLGHVNVLASVIFSGMSGSASADAAGLGRILVKAMADAGYSRLYAATVTAASATLGPILPPSIPAIVFAILAQQSVLKIFVAAIVPGLLLAGIMMVMCTYYAIRDGYPTSERAALPEIVASGRGAFWPMLTPILLLLGMYSGFFTATEAAAVAVIYALALVVVYGRDNLRRTLRNVVNDAEQTVIDAGIVLMIIAMVGIYGWVLTRYQIPAYVLELILDITQNKWMILILVNLLLVVAGMFMATTPSLLILVPIMLPVIDATGMDRTVFGLIMILNLVMGSMTPPVGNVLIILSRVGEVPYEKLAWALVPWYIPFVVVIILIAVFPGIALWLPNLLGF